MRRYLSMGFLAVIVATGATAQPTMSFGAAQVVAEGLTPGSGVAWFSVSREQPTMITVVVPRQGITVADGNGVAAFALDGPAPPRSVWVVVDLTDGQFGVATPAGFPLRDRSPAGNSVTPGHGRLSLRVGSSPTDRAHVMLVRPGVGAWSMLAWDGGTGDEDGEQDGAPSLSVKDLVAVGDSPPPPSAVAKGDVLVLIRPLDLSFSVARVAAGNAG